MKILLGFAFGHRGQEPGLSNEDMGSYAAANWSEWGYHSLQKEIAQVVERLGLFPEHVVGGGGLAPGSILRKLFVCSLTMFSRKGLFFLQLSMTCFAIRPIGRVVSGF